MLPDSVRQWLARTPDQPEYQHENENEKKWPDAFHGSTKPSGGVGEVGFQKFATFGNT